MTAVFDAALVDLCQPRAAAGRTADRDADGNGRLLRYARQGWYAMRRLWWGAYWSLDVQGLENVPRRGPVLLCANHASHLDAPAILAALPRETALRARTAAAKDVFGDYRWRDLLSRLTTGALPVERGADFAGGLRALEAVLRSGRPLILFPEGRRSADGALVDFKSGAAMLAIRSGAPIVPVRIDGMRESLPRDGKFPRPGKVRVRFAAPIDPRPYRAEIESGATGRRQAYERMTAVLREAVSPQAATLHA